MTTQKSKTIRFWDNLYASEPTHHKEWILHPCNLIFQHLWEQLPVADTDLRQVKILEVGSGTSTLSRDFYEYCRQRQQQPTARNGSVVSVCATDVSSICIEQCQQRDQELLGKEEETGGLEYRVLDIADPNLLQSQNDDELSSSDAQSSSLPLKPETFDMILDKGCLDTFLFRSRQRGNQKDTLPQIVLHNIHCLLKKETGIYAVITPRSKFFALRDYPGFAQVNRIRLEQDAVRKAELVEQQQTEGQAKLKQNGKPKDETLYLYTCYKGNKHAPPAIPTTPTLMIPSEDSACPNCGISFVKYRKGEDMKGRGAKFWVRQWKGHRKHCRGNNESSS